MKLVHARWHVPCRGTSSEGTLNPDDDLHGTRDEVGRRSVLGLMKCGLDPDEGESSVRKVVYDIQRRPFGRLLSPFIVNVLCPNV